METLSQMDQHLIRRAAGVIAVADAHVQKALKRAGKRDRISRDLLEISLTLMEDAQQILVLVSIPVPSQKQQEEQGVGRAVHRMRKTG